VLRNIYIVVFFLNIVMQKCKMSQSQYQIVFSSRVCPLSLLHLWLTCWLLIWLWSLHMFRTYYMCMLDFGFLSQFTFGKYKKHTILTQPVFFWGILSICLSFALCDGR